MDQLSALVFCLLLLFCCHLGPLDEEAFTLGYDSVLVNLFFSSFVLLCFRRVGSSCFLEHLGSNGEIINSVGHILGGMLPVVVCPELRNSTSL